MSRKSRFRGPFEKQYGKGGQALLKSPSQHIYHIHQSQLSQVSRKKSILLTWKILGLLVNTLSADDKYLVLNRENLIIPIEMPLSQKHKTFSEFFSPFLKSTLNSEHLEKKNDPKKFFSYKLTDYEKVVR